jgi:hypothetical protein
MSYFGSQYHGYVPPFISGTEKVKITITKPTPTQEMEQRIRMRYAFAMSAFGRMFEPRGISHQMRSFCYEWAQNITELPPYEDLYKVDRYFLELWKLKSQQ